jgi:hypothetical protein
LTELQSWGIGLRLDLNVIQRKRDSVYSRLLHLRPYFKKHAHNWLTHPTQTPWSTWENPRQKSTGLGSGIDCEDLCGDIIGKAERCIGKKEIGNP